MHFSLHCSILFLDDIYTEKEIKTNVHIEPANTEKTRKIGCFVACVLKKLNLVSTYKYVILIL